MLENAGNAISERLDFKIFWGGMPPDPPRGSHLQCSFTQPPTSFTQPATSKLTESTVPTHQKYLGFSWTLAGVKKWFVFSVLPFVA